MNSKLVLLLLLVIGFLAYLPSLFNGFVGDDFLQIVSNTQVHSLASIPHFFTGSTYESGGTERITGIFFRPLMMSCFALLYSLFGANPFPYHLFQVILHIVNGILLFYFLHFFFKNIYSFLIALLFLVHPINSEAVVYSANLQETLFFFFGMISLLLIQSKQVTYRNSLLIGMCFFLSLLSKESGVLFILIGGLYGFLMQKKKRWIVSACGLIVLLFYLYLRYGVAKMYLSQGSIAPIYQASLSVRLLNIPAIVFYYLQTFIFPFTLGIDQFWIVRQSSFADFYLPLFVLVGIFFLFLYGGFYFYRYHKRMFHSYVFFSWWFVLGLVLHIQILPLDATVADRWFYFPIVGLLGILGLLASLVKIEFSAIFRFFRMVIICVLLLFTTLTFLRSLEWKDDLTLYSHDIHTTKKNFVLDNAYATALINNGEFESAKPYIISSLDEYPYYANLNNMAIVFVFEKKYTQAKKDLLEATRISKNYQVYENYSSFLLVYDNIGEADRFTKGALFLFPYNPKLWLNMAKISYVKGDTARAVSAAGESNKLQSTEESKLVYVSLLKGKKINVTRLK